MTRGTARRAAWTTNGFPRGRTRPARGTPGRLAVLVLALLGFQLASLVAPAYACGCGAMVPEGRHRVSVGRETSVVRWDGREEQIVMRLTVAGDARTAAWIMPVPNRASVELGDAALFDRLAEETAPEYRERQYFWPRSGDWPFDASEEDGAAGAAPGDGAVDVVGRERLGPFDVARLTATDSGALGDWLDDNGFALPARLDTALEPYVRQKWEYVAIKLVPRDTAGDVPLGGALDPLHLTFASDAPVYPMRLSRLATTPQALDLYILAAHRMEPGSAIGGEEPRVTFAGRIGTAGGALGDLTAGGTDFLTAVEQDFPRPSRISGDHTLRRAAADDPYRKVIHVDEMWTVGGMPGWLFTFGLGMAVLAVKAVAVAIVLRRNARKQPPPPMAPGPWVPPGGPHAGYPQGGQPYGAPVPPATPVPPAAPEPPADHEPGPGA
ncbi:DUF2330 domain-containing protein [Streptomyces sp. HM190]|uniref:DUF2330 domain-containing protein n=1 Tax=Streptomyces sp. HM190 TaxID=2695266 RepID=UPI0013599E7B|nr:DUF2330 domain-containing protein [Streptomyces sp. HM190]